MAGPDNAIRPTKHPRASDATPMKNMPLKEGRNKKRRASHDQSDMDPALVPGKRQRSDDLGRPNSLAVKTMTHPEAWTLSDTIAGQFRDIDPVLTSDEQ